MEMVILSFCDRNKHHGSFLLTFARPFSCVYHALVHFAFMETFLLLCFPKQEAAPLVRPRCSKQEPGSFMFLYEEMTEAMTRLSLIPSLLQHRCT